MQIKTILKTTATALLLSTTSLTAQENPVINTIVQDIVDLGYTRIEVTARGNTITVEATGEAGTIERTYDPDGNLLSEEITDPNATLSDETEDEDTDEDEADDEGDDGDDHDGDDDGDGGDDHDGEGDGDGDGDGEGDGDGDGEGDGDGDGDGEGDGDGD